MEIIPEWAPNVHPIVVHFPIAIILLAAALDLLHFILPDRWWEERKTTILYGIGTLAALAAYYTGTIAADSVFLPPAAQSILNEHAGWAWWTIWFFGIYTLLRIILHWYEKMDIKSIRLALFALALPGLFFLYETGDHGAEMVFGYGAGTGQLLQNNTPSLSTDSLAVADTTTFSAAKSGRWTWPIGPHGVSTLLSRFHWLEGSAAGLQPSAVKSNDNYLLRLQAKEGPYLFTSRNTHKNVQVDYHLDISNFEGTITFVNHLQDAGNYDFVTLSPTGTISQGRVSNGERQVFAREQYSASGFIFIRTVVNGTHFRAYINRKMAVHGHGDAPEAGSVGLRLEGKGTVLIDSISMTPLDE